MVFRFSITDKQATHTLTKTLCWKLSTRSSPWEVLYERLSRLKHTLLQDQNRTSTNCSFILSLRRPLSRYLVSSCLSRFNWCLIGVLWVLHCLSFADGEAPQSSPGHMRLNSVSITTHTLCTEPWALVRNPASVDTFAKASVISLAQFQTL